MWLILTGDSDAASTVDWLCLQGFCLPAEYSDDTEGEGATDFVDIEGGGIGDGEGAKDVSEQIESEDQVSRSNVEQHWLIDEPEDVMSCSNREQHQVQQVQESSGVWLFCIS